MGRRKGRKTTPPTTGKKSPRKRRNKGKGVDSSGAHVRKIPVDSLRRCLAVVRRPTTTPNTILPSGELAGVFAHDYIKSSAIKSS